MRIGIVLPANILHAPYLQYYTDILEKEGIKYDVIFWNKLNLKEKGNYIAFNYKCNYGTNKIKKLLGYILFSRFVKKIVKKNEYNKLIVLVPQIALFLGRFLKENYLNNYILDIRDYNISLKFHKKLNEIIKMSNKTIISSEGFKTWLPEEKDYIISHNINLSLLNDHFFSPPDFHNKQSFIISNIGSIRHFNENKNVIDQLSNNDSYLLNYIGQGVCEKDLENYCQKQNIKNVAFFGRYEKNDELNFYIKSDLINLIQPKDHIGAKTAMANRIYNACIAKRPVIISKGTYMAEIVKKYNLGLVVDIDRDDLQRIIKKYIKDYNKEQFLIGCGNFIEKIKKDEEAFENEVKKFLRSLR